MILQIIHPSFEYQEQVLEYKAEFLQNGENMAGTAGLEKQESFDAWYQSVCANSSKETVAEGLVPASTYLAIRIQDNRLVGMIEIRHELNQYLLQHGGHIGYSVRKSEQRKGYATEMLRLALVESKALGLSKVLITCDKNNIASSKTMLNNGAVLENEIDEGNRITQRYWIDL